MTDLDYDLFINFHNYLKRSKSRKTQSHKNHNQNTAAGQLNMVQSTYWKSMCLWNHLQKLVMVINNGAR